MALFQADSGRPVVVGHRGMRAHRAPENTLPACQAAHAAGATWVELDARRSADGIVVLRHDGHAPGGAAVVDCSAEALGEQGLARLDEVLERLPDGLAVDIEVKNVPGEPDYDPDDRIVDMVAEVVAPHVGDRPLLLSSFNPLTVAKLGAVLPDVPTGLVHFDSLSVTAAATIAAEFSAAVVCSQVSSPGLDTEGIAAVHKGGRRLLVWTVNDVSTAARLAVAGADALCTDDPAALVAALDSGAVR